LLLDLAYAYGSPLNENDRDQINTRVNHRTTKNKAIQAQKCATPKQAL